MSAVEPDRAAASTALDAIRAAARAAQLPITVPVDRADFVSHYYAQADAEDLERDPGMLAAAALSHLEFAKARTPGEPKVRVFNPTLAEHGFTSPHTIVQTVNDDMPFLVDSLSMNLTTAGHTIHVTIHPLLQVQRSASGELVRIGPQHGAPKDAAAHTESFIHFEIVRETDPRILESVASMLMSTLRDVRAAVDDWQPMVAKLRAAIDELRRAEAPQGADMLEESCAFLEWLAAYNFTLLGYREYELVYGDTHDELRPLPDTGLGLLRDAPSDDVVRLSGAARLAAYDKNPLVITKSNRRSTVHRPVPLDHISVKVFGSDGRPKFERRFLGLFTSPAYNESPRDIPLLRLKVRRLMEESGLDPNSHRGKTLQNILDTLPRDELLQASIDELRTIAFGALGLQNRHRLRLFCRREPFGRYYSCIVYLPREQHNSRAQRTVERILLERLGGTHVESSVTISEAAHARLTVTVRTAPSQPTVTDLAPIQAELESAVRSWADRLREALLLRLPEDRALALLHEYGERFTAAYREEADAARASHDIEKLALLRSGAADLEMSLERSPRAERLRFTTFKRDEPIPLHVALPVLENIGFKVVSERVYPLRFGESALYIQDFELDAGSALDPTVVGERMKECFRHVFRGDAENDGFNSFVIRTDLDWREAALLRAICKYVLQTQIGFSQSYILEVLERFPAFCAALIHKFKARFDVDTAAELRAKQEAASDAVLRAELERVVSLDDDRILRAFASVVGAILRTNYFQVEDGRHKDYVSFKLDPTAVPELPKPRPKFEIFVYSVRVEGVHLRSSKIARGGIRWSDRREDFRTEVLGLMKAQQVKNTVIVPNGAKGGFVCKSLPVGDRDAIQREVVECYRTFIRGLLDITDNIVNDAVVPPERVLRRDDDDPYLVVAADKGTAAFSDIANALANEYGFWLGDAFASGGSAGYDHKKMGITARGAWESVKRHFRELGVDVRKETITAVGIGDMSGDVFGNGMLQSSHLKLVAAFDHRHIFIDPDPDPARSFAERKRLFELPRSSWDDYDKSLLSPGGGVYSRQTKSIALSAEAQVALGIAAESLTPPELIRAILCAPVDLLWNGGIGTYVKSSRESHAEVRDPANEAMRVDGRDLRCRVVAEGGNLGFTQLGRIEYAEHGGRINTDFIDNSGGVDSSDREVNIKILLADAIRRRALAREDRDALLASMTNDVAGLVLADNYAQTQALSIMESRAAERLGEHARLIRVLEAQGLLDRALEFLPSDSEMEERRSVGRGLTRPELAIILSYSKIELFDSLAHTDIPEDPYLGTELESYFPPQLRAPIGGLIRKHRLARQIIAMLIGGSMINRMGPFFVLRAEEETGASVAQIARAYAIVRDVFEVRRLWREIEALDYEVPASVQYDSIFQVGRMVRRAVYWLLQNYSTELDIEPMVTRFRPGVLKMLDALPGIAVGRSADAYTNDAARYAQRGLPQRLAERIAALRLMTQVLDVIELAREFRLPIPEVGKLYFELAHRLKLDVLREQIENLAVHGRWSAMGRATLRETLAHHQRALMRGVLATSNERGSTGTLDAWLERHAAEVGRVQATLDDMLASGPLDFAMLSVALNEVQRLV